VLNAWQPVDGGFIFADAPNVVTSAAAIIPQISMHQNTARVPATRLSPVSSQASGGFMTTAQANSFLVPN
jgi:hypothetical protein